VFNVLNGCIDIHVDLCALHIALIAAQSTGTTSKHRSRANAHSVHLQDLAVATSPPSQVPIITRSDGLARNPPVVRSLPQTAFFLFN
jgi:hypothetical protein